MNLFQIISRKIINTILRVSIRGVEYFHNRDELKQREIVLANYPDGTLGKDISNCLKKNKLRELPYFKDHDLKHVLLGYDMNSVDEIRLQAFMIGNGNHTFPAFALFIGGALLLPEKWVVFFQDYLRGKSSVPISSWTVETHGKCNTAALQEIVFNQYVECLESTTHKTLLFEMLVQRISKL